MLPLAALALLAAVATIVVHVVYFPNYSPDADEAAYLLQARALADGHLTLSASAHGQFLRPWLTGEHDGRLFTKYLPGLPAVLAVSIAGFGSAVPALAAIAAGWVAATYAAAVQLMRSRRTALTAAGLIAVSPITLVQSALYLSYALSATLLFGGVAAVLHGVRLQRRFTLVAGGALFGAALLTRPFDVVLVVVPLLGLVLLRHRRDLWSAARAMCWPVLGGLPFVALLLAYNAAVTGSPSRMPLPAVEPLDDFGFGLHRIMPGDPLTPYSARLAVSATARSLAEVPQWTAGGLLLVVLAVLGAIVARPRLETLFLLTVGLAFPVGYFSFWGLGITSQGLGSVIGPYYYVAAFVPLTLLAATGSDWLLRRLPRVPRIGLVAALGAVGAALTFVNVQPNVRFFVEYRQATDRLLTLVQPSAQVQTPAVVLVRKPYGSPFVAVNHPFLDNDPALRQPVLFASSRSARDVDLPDEVPGRALYLLQPDLAFGENVLAPTRVGSLEPITVVRGTRLRIGVEARADRPGVCLSSYVAWEGVRHTRELTCASGPGQVYRDEVLLGQGGQLPLPPPDSRVLLVVGVAERVPGLPTEDLREVRLSLGTRSDGSGTEVRVLTPGEPWRFVNFPGRSAWAHADVGDDLRYRVTAE